jgi:phenylacetate-coenzyme A ligase PaaK-like adenylate-forming protein
MTGAARSADPRELAGELMARTRWTTEQLAAHQREQLAGLLRHAVANSPYYRRVLGAGAAGGDVPLHELPTLTKSTLMEHFDEIGTVKGLDREAAEAHLAGARGIAGYRVFATAGSTGRRGIFVYSRTEFAVWVAAQLRMLLVMGVTPNMRVAAIGAPSPQHISRQMFAELTAGRSDAASDHVAACSDAAPDYAAGRPDVAPELSVTTPLPEMVAALNAYRPDAIPTYASIAALLAEEQLAGRLRIGPAMVGTGAEVLTEEMRRRIRAAWGREPHQGYLATEVPLLASTCAEQVGMHLWEDLTLVEVVDADDEAVSPGVPGHKVLITNLVNRSQPLIRYELSDSVTLAAGPNPAGLPFRRLAAVEGRSDDIVTLPAQGGGAVAVHPLRLRAPFAALPDVVQYQVAHDDSGLSVHIVARAEAARDIAERVRAALAGALRAAGALPPPITVTAVPKIDREAGHAAKFKLIRSTGRSN